MFINFANNKNKMICERKEKKNQEKVVQSIICYKQVRNNHNQKNLWEMKRVKKNSSTYEKISSSNKDIIIWFKIMS